jgi:hypothetical protein
MSNNGKIWVISKKIDLHYEKYNILIYIYSILLKNNIFERLMMFKNLKYKLNNKHSISLLTFNYIQQFVLNSKKCALSNLFNFCNTSINDKLKGKSVTLSRNNYLWSFQTRCNYKWHKNVMAFTQQLYHIVITVY